MLLDPPPGEHPIMNIPRAQPPLYPIMYITEYDNCNGTKTDWSFTCDSRVIHGHGQGHTWPKIRSDMGIRCRSAQTKLYM